MARARGCQPSPNHSLGLWVRIALRLSGTTWGEVRACQDAKGRDRAAPRPASPNCKLCRRKFTAAYPFRLSLHGESGSGLFPGRG